MSTLSNWKFIQQPRINRVFKNFKLEPGFYTAALWISYPIVLIILIPLLTLGFLLDSMNSFFKLIYPLIILFSFMLQIPLMRIARAILLNMTIDYTTKC